MAFLRSVPLALVEGGHVVGSLCGLLLLLLSTRFERAERWALRPAVWALTIGIGCTLLRGFGIPQAIILTVLLLTLLAGRSALQSAARTRRPLPSDPAWLLTVGMTLCAAIFLTTLSFWSTFEDQAQWLRVDYLATGARALRTLTVVTAVAALVALPVGAGWQAKLPRRRRRRG
jgi:phosphatidylglycerol lysyltransferase